jgi:hypothetical protein
MDILVLIMKLSGVGVRMDKSIRIVGKVIHIIGILQKIAVHVEKVCLH